MSHKLKGVPYMHSAITFMFHGKWAGIRSEYQQHSKIKQAEVYFGKKYNLRSLTVERLEGYQRHLRILGNCPATINRKVNVLTSMCRHLWLCGKLKAAVDVRPLEVIEPAIRYLEADQLEEAIVSSLHNKPLHHTIIVLADTGARVGELVAYLKEGNTEQDQMTLSKTKNGKSRTVPLTKRASESLQALAMHKVSYEKLKNDWNKLRAVLGHTTDKDWTLHILRHTCATRLVRAGVALEVVQKMLGHSSPAMTLRYAHQAPSYLQEAVAALEGE